MREDVRERDHERLGQLFIKQQPHELRRRHAEGATLALGGVRQAGPNIIGGQLRKLGQQLSFYHAAGQIREDVAHGDARAFDARLAEANLGIHGDAIQGAHRRLVYGKLPSRYPADREPFYGVWLSRGTLHVAPGNRAWVHRTSGRSREGTTNV